MAAIDFSDLTKPQPKPQGFQMPPLPPKQTNAQGFYSPDKIPEEKKVLSMEKKSMDTEHIDISMVL